jgi:hypothetical protein
MKILDKLVNLFGLNDETWLQHSNPWSVWTRLVILPLLTLAIWSREWIGIYCLIPIALMMFWTWINPRFFGKPKTTKHWSSKAVFGERVWLNKKEHPLPKHHTKAILILNIITGAGLPVLGWGLYALNVWACLLGLAVIIFGKMWFLDRMVWIYEDMKVHSKKYSSWEY